VPAELLEVLVAERTDLRAPQASLAEQEHDRQVAAAAARAAIGHKEEAVELRPGQSPWCPPADGEQVQLLGLERLEALEQRGLGGGPGHRWRWGRGRCTSGSLPAAPDGKGHRIAFL